MALVAAQIKAGVILLVTAYVAVGIYIISLFPPPPYPLPPFSSSLWFLWTLSTMFTCRHHWSCSGSWCRSAMEARGPAPGARMARMITWFPRGLRTTCNQSSVGIHGYSPAALWSFRSARSHFQYYSSELLSWDAGCVGVGGGGCRGGGGSDNSA